MQCSKCNSHFCWLCLKITNNGYMHLNEMEQEVECEAVRENVDILQI